MSMVIKSKQILTATLIVALGAAVSVNWYYTNTQNPDDNTRTTQQSVSGALGDSLYVAGTTAADTEQAQDTTDVVSQSVNQDEYFAEAKLKRTETYDEVLDEIEDLIENSAENGQLNDKIYSLTESYKANMKAQTDAENLIKAKTSSECIVIINENNCQVILQKNTLNDTIILQITEIIEKNTNISAENLTIIEVK